MDDSRRFEESKARRFEAEAREFHSLIGACCISFLRERRSRGNRLAPLLRGRRVDRNRRLLRCSAHRDVCL
jgi:hypothetical protein